MGEKLTSSQVHRQVRNLAGALAKELRQGMRSSSPSSVAYGLARLMEVREELAPGAVPVMGGPTWSLLRDANNGTVRRIVDRLDPTPDGALTVVEELEDLALAIAEQRVPFAHQPAPMRPEPSTLAKVLRWLADHA